MNIHVCLSGGVCQILIISESPCSEQFTDVVRLTGVLSPSHQSTARLETGVNIDVIMIVIILCLK